MKLMCYGPHLSFMEEFAAVPFFSNIKKWPCVLALKKATDDQLRTNIYKCKKEQQTQEWALY